MLSRFLLFALAALVVSWGGTETPAHAAPPPFVVAAQKCDTMHTRLHKGFSKRRNRRILRRIRKIKNRKKRKLAMLHYRNWKKRRWKRVKNKQLLRLLRRYGKNKQTFLKKCVKFELKRMTMGRKAYKAWLKKMRKKRRRRRRKRRRRKRNRR